MNTNRIYLLIVLITASALSTFAQRTESSLSDKQNIVELEKKMSFKIIRFSVYGINTTTGALDLKNLMESKQGIISCKTDIDNGICTVFAEFKIQRKDIVGITGPAGIKTSNYSEEVHLKKNPVVNTGNNKRNNNELNERRILDTYQGVNTISKEVHNNKNPVVNTGKDRQNKNELNKIKTKETYRRVNTTPLEEAPKPSRKVNNYQYLTTEEKISHIEGLKNIAIQKGSPTGKYDLAIKKLKNE